MKYSPKFFKNDFPEWKRKKDSVLLKILYRPISFLVTSIFAALKLTSNQVSFLSLFVAVVASALFLVDSFVCKCVGCFLIFLWMILDCVDGNLARSIKTYPYGEFIDAISSYTLIALLFPCIGMSVYYTGGIIIRSGCEWFIFLGSITGLSDALSRLYYQKYLNNSQDYVQEKNQKSLKTQTDGKLSKLNDRVGKEIGLNGLFIPFLFVSTFCSCLDIFVIFYACFYIGRFILSFLVLLKKTKCLRK